MAEQKPEKVNISLAPSSKASSPGASESSSASTTGATQPSSAPETEESRSTDASTDAPNDADTSKATRADSGVAANQDQDQEEGTEDSLSDSNPLRQRVGQETTVKPPETPTSQESGPPADEQQPGGKEVTGSKEASEQDNQTATDEPDNTEGQAKEGEESEETPPATIHDVDFYSSKMDTNNPSPARGSTTSSTHNGGVSTSFGVILLVFITTLIVGLVVLYQLEQAQPGSGIIFDWFS
jgi:hypothetical protein